MSWPSLSARTKTWTTEVLTAADLDGQYDVLHTYVNDMLNGTTGHAHTGGTNDGPKITLTTGVTGTLPLANGGTGVVTLAALGSLFYPIGSVYANYSDSTNPGTLLGFGTWVAIAGYTLVGIDGTTEFLTPGQTGGEKTHTLITGEMPAHTHVQNVNDSSGGSLKETTYVTQGGQITGNTTTSSTGGGSAHNNLQPYCVVYLWRRSA